MKRSHTGSIIGRREFLKRGVLAGVGVSILPLAGSAGASIEAAPQIRRYSPLGKTGLKISDISFGGSRLHPATRMSSAMPTIAASTISTAPIPTRAVNPRLSSATRSRASATRSTSPRRRSPARPIRKTR